MNDKADDHYARAEELLTTYREAEAAGRALTTSLQESGVSSEELSKVADMLIKGSTLILLEAQVHATLATVVRDESA